MIAARLQVIDKHLNELSKRINVLNHDKRTYMQMRNPWK
jgi:hypothetical protein